MCVLDDFITFHHRVRRRSSPVAPSNVLCICVQIFQQSDKRIYIMERPERVASAFVETRTQCFGCRES